MRWSIPYAVEGVVFFACACQYTFDMVQYQFIYQVVSEELNFTKDHSVDYCSPNTTSDEDEQAVADEVSRWTMFSMLSGYVTCAIGATLFTSWSDSIGRKKAIAFPVLGTFIAAVMQCIIVTYRLPLYTLIITELLYGASGSYSAMLNIGSSYLSDTVKPEDRARRFSILEVFASVGGGLVQIGTGYWINSGGFVPTSIFISCCAFVAAILIPFMETKKVDVIEEFSERSPLLNEGTYEVKVVGKDPTPNSGPNNKSLCKQIQSSWKIYAIKRCVCRECLEDLDNEPKHLYTKKERRWRLWFYALAFAIYMFGVNGTGQFMTMFLVSYPVCFTPNLVGAQLGLANGLIIVIPFLIILFQDYLKFEALAIILIGTLSACASSLIISFAKGPTLVFAGTALSMMYSFTTAFIRSEAAGLVSAGEQGAALAVISALENLACIFSPIAFLTLYPATLYIYHGFSLAVAAMVYAATFLLMAVVWIANKRY